MVGLLLLVLLLLAALAVLMLRASSACRALCRGGCGRCGSGCQLPSLRFGGTGGWPAAAEQKRWGGARKVDAAAEQKRMDGGAGGGGATGVGQERASAMLPAWLWSDVRVLSSYLGNLARWATQWDISGDASLPKHGGGAALASGQAAQPWHAPFATRAFRDAPEIDNPSAAPRSCRQLAWQESSFVELL